MKRRINTTLISVAFIYFLFSLVSYAELDREYLNHLSIKSVDEIKETLKSKTSDEQAEYSLELSKLELNKRNFSTAQIWLDYVLKEFPQHYSTCSQAWCFKAQLSWAQSNYHGFFINIDNAIEASKKANEYDRLKYYVHLKAGNEHSIGMLKESKQTLNQLIDLAESNSDKEAKLTALHESALLSYKMGNIEEAKDLALTANEFNLSIQNVHAQGMIDKTLGNIARGEEKPKEAEEYFSKAIKSFTEINNHHEVGNCFYNRSLLKIDTGSGSAAILDLHEAIYNFTRSGSTGGVGMSHMTLGSTCLGLKKLDAAEIHLDLARFFNKRSNSQFRLAQTYMFLGNLAIAKEDSRVAVEYYSHSKRIYLELGLENDAKRISRLIKNTQEMK
tara:strand:- start:1708 stop:2871 length:1164 start_codon:yes stop_codon:yes gene_type:complete